jgi:hypothetical protein
MIPVDNGDEQVAKGPLSLSEIMNLRHMINDHLYRRRVRRTMKIWLFTLGTTTTLMAAGLTVWKEISARLWK